MELVKLNNEIIVKKAKQLGFDLVGFAPAEMLAEEGNHLKDWLTQKHNAGMEYMEKNFEKRVDVKKIFPEAVSVISLGLNYYNNEMHSVNEMNGKISRYAWGKDYHLVIWEKLNILIDDLKEIDSSFDAVSYVDTGPVMDKVWAVRSGIGWMGKHTNVINRQIGSWFFIANIITNYNFDYNIAEADYCGSCTACLDACPTNAIVREYSVDANKCISYLTIENKNEIPEEFKGKFENWIFGCDICQDVCPWNHKSSTDTTEKEFTLIRNKELNIDQVLRMEQEEFSERFRHTPIKRTKLKGLKRNAEFLKKDS
jgi:epoxyqueuosine reductase